VSTPFSLPSFAKVNLSLRILGKRPDGYHEIRTVLQTVSLHDTIQFAPNEGSEIFLTCDEPLVPTDRHNLIVKSAHALKDRFGIDAGARIDLEKRIPMQSGLGGGSSNAAIALLGLVQLWELKTNIAELTEIAAALGADVPFFLSGGRALATGTGTTISPLEDAAQQDLLLVSPNAKISTSEAYKALQAPALTTSNSDFILAVSRTEVNSADSDLTVLRDDLVNDFERTIFDMEPEIGRAKEALLQAGARDALLAGSGSSVFGIFGSRREQERGLVEFRAESGWRTFSCETVTREEYSQAISFGGTQLLRSFDLRIDTGA